MMAAIQSASGAAGPIGPRRARKRRSASSAVAIKRTSQSSAPAWRHVFERLDELKSGHQLRHDDAVPPLEVDARHLDGERAGEKLGLVVRLPLAHRGAQ